MADSIREFAFKQHIEPARRQGERSVTIRAGDMHKDMGLFNRMPDVISALGSKKFEKQFKIKRLKVEGPLHSSSTIFIFDI